MEQTLETSKDFVYEERGTLHTKNGRSSGEKNSDVVVENTIKEIKIDF